MNVTVKLPDDLCRRARHRAVDESKSLSAWLAKLVERELSAPSSPHETPKTWVDAFVSEQPDWFYEKDLPLENRKSGHLRKPLFGGLTQSATRWVYEVISAQIPGSFGGCRGNRSARRFRKGEANCFAADGWHFPPAPD